MRRIRTTLALLVAAAVAVAAIGASANASTTSRLGGDKNIVETAVAAGQFKTLASLLTKTGPRGHACDRRPLHRLRTHR